MVPPAEAQKEGAAPPTSRIKTYVKGLDDGLQGGIPRGHVVLVSGFSGTMKSSLTFNILYNLAKEKKGTCLYISLEQSRESLLRHMKNLGMDVSVAFQPNLTVMDLAYLRHMVESDKQQEGEIKWLDSIFSLIRNAKEMNNIDVLGFDSLAALYSLANFKNPRAELFHFFDKLRSLKLTNFLISEMPAGHHGFGPYGIEEFLSDGIIHLDLEKERRTVNLYISVVKMRETKHVRGYFPLLFSPTGGFEIVTK